MDGVMKHLLADTLVIGMSAALLWHFSNIWRYGEHLVGEPNVFIRSAETGMLLVILVFGIYRFVTSLRDRE